MDVHLYTSAAFVVAISTLTAAFVLSMVRLLAGPTLPDRVIALDLMAFIMIAFIAVYAVFSDQPVFLNIALALGLMAFLGTVAFARFIERLSRTKVEADRRD